MIQLRDLRLIKVLNETLASGTVISEEGVALAFVKENGETKVIPSTGAAGEKFAGVAIARNTPPHTVPVVEKVVFNSTGVATLRKAPVAGQLMVKVGNSALTIVAAATDVTEVAISGTTLTTAAANAGVEAYVQYQFAPTVEEAQTVLGSLPYGGLAANLVNVVSAMKQGSVATNMYDASADWTDALYAKLSAGGKFAPATAATGLANVTVKNSPNEGNPFLVIDLNLG